jgi:hypothetical protein
MRRHLLFVLLSLLGCSKTNNIDQSVHGDPDAPPECAAEPPRAGLIDAFECGPPGALPAWEGRSGGWYTQSDDQPGNTFVDANDPAFDFEALRCHVGFGDSEWAACAEGKTAKCDLSEDCWGASIGVAMTKDGTPFDAAARGYTGVRFMMRNVMAAGPQSILLNVADNNTIPSGGICEACYDYFSKELTLTAQWQEVIVHWRDLAQTGFGDPQPAFDAATLQYFDWRIPPRSSLSLVIDDLAFVSD